MIIDDILEKYDVDYDDLTKDERSTLDLWMSALEKNQLTVEKIREYVTSLKDSIERELIRESEFNYIFIFKVPNRKQIFLKARLENVMTLEAFLMGPEKAKRAIENQIATMKKA